MNVASWLRTELARFNAIKGFVAALAAVTFVAAWALTPRVETQAAASPAARGPAIAPEARSRVREEAVERTLAALRGIRQAAVRVSDDFGAARVVVDVDPSEPLSVEACAVIVRLVCDAFPSVAARSVSIMTADGRTARAGGP